MATLQIDPAYQNINMEGLKFAIDGSLETREINLACSVMMSQLVPEKYEREMAELRKIVEKTKGLPTSIYYKPGTDRKVAIVDSDNSSVEEKTRFVGIIDSYGNVLQRKVYVYLNGEFYEAEEQRGRKHYNYRELFKKKGLERFFTH